MAKAREEMQIRKVKGSGRGKTKEVSKRMKSSIARLAKLLHKLEKATMKTADAVDAAHMLMKEVKIASAALTQEAGIEEAKASTGHEAGEIHEPGSENPGV